MQLGCANANMYSQHAYASICSVYAIHVSSYCYISLARARALSRVRYTHLLHPPPATRAQSAPAAQLYCFTALLHIPLAILLYCCTALLHIPLAIFEHLAPNQLLQHICTALPLYYTCLLLSSSISRTISSCSKRDHPNCFSAHFATIFTTTIYYY